jgi:type I restriction enzyme S subunit
MSSELISVHVLLSNGDLLLVQDGNHGGNYPKVDEFVNVGIPLITGACLDRGTIDYSQASYLTRERADMLRVGHALAGDVLLTHKGTMGKTAIVPESEYPFTVLNPQLTLYRVAPKGKLDGRYLKYYFDSAHFQELLTRISSTSTISTLSIREQKQLTIPVPKIATQKNVVDILGSLDDRITLLRETNTTLEVIAQALFKSWFVDFDPVHAKMQGRAPEGMDEATAALFPNSFEESELGAVPKGWRIQKFGDFIDRQSVGKKFDQKTAFASGQVPILDQGKSGVIGFHNEEPGIKASLEKPVVVFANHTCYMRLICFDFSAIQNVLPFVGKGVDTVWAFYATKDRIKFSEYKGHWPDFAIEKAVVPSNDLTFKFRSTVDPLVANARNNELQIQTLSVLRDTLLPRLISGQLQLSDVKPNVEEALG